MMVIMFGPWHLSKSLIKHSLTSHYFETDLVNLHYYKYGNGKQSMLCFHGFGMHGKQFRVLEDDLGGKYTFYGFDLFFHKETKLKNNSIANVKAGLSKKHLADLIAAFCTHENIDRFSVIGYSMGTHFATSLVEEMGGRIDEYIAIAPTAIEPGNMVRFVSKNKIGNRLFNKVLTSEKAIINLIDAAKFMGVMDATGRDILYKEICTDELRFNMYATFTYLRFLETDEARFIKSLEDNHIKAFFIFGKRDKMFPLSIAKDFLPKLNNPNVTVLDEGHEMINPKIVPILAGLLL